MLDIVAYLLQANGARCRIAAARARRRDRRSRRDRGAPANRNRRRRRRRPQARRAGARAGSAAPPLQRPHGHRRGEELRAGHRRDAAEAGSRRLADVPRQLSRLELQPAERDHERRTSAISSWPGCGRCRKAARTSRIRSCTTASSILLNPNNIVQALDARTGNLIWEQRAGPEQRAGYGGLRSFSIAQDKILFAASDARMVALDARTGRLLWETPVGDTAQGSFRHQRIDRDQRQGAAGPQRMRALQRARAAGSAPSTSRPASSRGSSTPSRRKARLAATRGERCPTCSAPAAKRGSPAATIRS